jgi:ComF family protein
MKLFRMLLDILFPPRSDEALVQEATHASLGIHAHARAIGARTAALLPYRARLVRACVLEAKFRDSERAQRLLASVLADYLSEWSADHEPFTEASVVLVPVPLSRERRRERGYNQAERVARKAAERMPAVAVDLELLVRTRDTLPQTSLDGAARRKNMQDAFQAVGTPDPGHTYIVFDDVLTTGTTLKAAMEALESAGARRVYGLALAY